jgi:hypothetical protein
MAGKQMDKEENQKHKIRKTQPAEAASFPRWRDSWHSNALFVLSRRVDADEGSVVYASHVLCDSSLTSFSSLPRRVAFSPFPVDRLASSYASSWPFILSSQFPSRTFHPELRQLI